MTTTQDALREVVKRLAALSLEQFEKENIVGVAADLGVKPEALLGWVKSARNIKKNVPTVIWRDSTEFVEIVEPPSIVEKIIIRGVITQLTGQPKAGKTTFLLDLASKAIAGEPFLKEVTTAGTVLYVSEQNLVSFTTQMVNSGLLTRERQQELRPPPKHRFQYLCSEDWFHLSWNQIVDATLDHGLQVHGALVVFDTINAISRIVKENDAGEMRGMLNPLKLLSNAGMSVIYSMHRRKSGGDTAESSMGSTAAPGFCDTILALEAAEPRMPKTYRKLDVKGRFNVQERIIERKTSGAASRYELVGEPTTVRVRDLKGQIMELFVSEDTELSATDIKEKVQRRKASVAAALDELVEFGELQRSGEGTKKDPCMYCLSEGRNRDTDVF